MSTAGPNMSNPKEIAETGEKIYSEKYRTDFELRYQGKYVAIEVKTGDAYVGDTSSDALQEARIKSPNGIFHLIKVGASGAFRMSYTNANVDWAFR
jgi:hypothetical protein